MRQWRKSPYGSDALYDGDSIVIQGIPRAIVGLPPEGTPYTWTDGTSGTFTGRHRTVSSCWEYEFDTGDTTLWVTLWSFQADVAKHLMGVNSGAAKSDTVDKL